MAETSALLMSTTGERALNGPFVSAPSLPKPVVDGDFPVRLQMKSTVSNGFCARCVEFKNRKRAAPPAGGSQSYSDALAEANEKVAPSKIDEIGLPCPVQTNIPRIVTCGTETNIGVWHGQGNVRRACKRVNTAKGRSYNLLIS